MKRLSKTAVCPICGDINEDSNHILFSCPWARVVWAASPVGFMFYPSPSPSHLQNMALCLGFVDNRKAEGLTSRLQCGPWILWRLWKHRNDRHFGSFRDDPETLLQKALEDAREWSVLKETPRQGISKIDEQQSLKLWKKPPDGTLKCNVDASWKVNASICGVGWVLRNAEGQIKWFGAKAFPSTPSAVEAEALAMWWAIRCVTNHRQREVIFEGDSANVVEAFESPDRWPLLKGYAKDIAMMHSTIPFMIKWCPRTANVVADRIAEYAATLPRYVGTIECVPPGWLQPLVTCDRNCVSI